ncbi:Lrp/AsnC family transcriptional regulator [Phycisphaera mikurensis]|uniref:Siroheme decarboxylase AsnC-like ligand binding domain-containing protein n=1 Tax=Phycisphaera mikurensis (strain NBRC 102666 / KCTC 22515 / FYK2301M01) TaxID=1142394 RepID=I0II24_PHYMF|nr:Lrp/AsnC family transcriptional regulator [Phycisphaera mikurensis]MBB6442524.1 hypothetical protein [Phycisphaera mikurensis]BAM04912.1 hypothetical protein PSMK_27530 [Phycisphaera mikurensis NBRC 102666]
MPASAEIEPASPPGSATGSVDDPLNRRILAVSEDTLQGFHRRPMHEIAERSGVAVEDVVRRIQAMLRSGAVRRVRQTMLATSLAPGALVAWRVPPAKLLSAFDFMAEHDPFSGHVVLRTTDGETPGSGYRLWTTLKVPRPFSLEAHAEWLQRETGAEAFRLLPAKKLFALGVGHVRRKEIEPGDRTDAPGRVQDTAMVDLDDRQWRVLDAIKREFTPEELEAALPDGSIWSARAAEAGERLDGFYEVAESLQRARVVGRFSTFLEHVKPHADGARVTRFNALFHWKVPEGQEIEAGLEIGRHHCMTHAYWREGGPEFGGVNMMGVSHGTDKARVLEHKAAIDRHLEEAGISVGYTNVFWGGKSEIKPSEVSPRVYAAFAEERGIA